MVSDLRWPSFRQIYRETVLLERAKNRQPDSRAEDSYSRSPLISSMFHIFLKMKILDAMAPGLFITTFKSETTYDQLVKNKKLLWLRTILNAPKLKPHKTFFMQSHT